MPISLHVLLVMRDDHNQNKLKELLYRVNYQVTSVSSRSKALELLRTKKIAPDGSVISYDIVLKEHEPPKVDGLKFLRSMNKETLLNKPPVILVSHQDDPEKVAMGLHMGAADYLVQPLRINELRNLWTHVWRQRNRAELPSNTVAHLGPVAGDDEDGSTDGSSQGTGMHSKRMEGQGTSRSGGMRDCPPAGMNQEMTDTMMHLMQQLQQSQQQQQAAQAVSHAQLAPKGVR